MERTGDPKMLPNGFSFPVCRPVGSIRGAHEYTAMHARARPRPPIIVATLKEYGFSAVRLPTFSVVSEK